MRNKSDKGLIAQKHIEKYLEIAERTGHPYSKKLLGKLLFEEYPDLFKDAEDGRYFIRIVLGQNGKLQYKDDKSVELTQRMLLVPDQIKELNFEPYIVENCYNNTLAIADLHSRFMDRKAFEIAVNYGIDKKCNSVLINGDFLDFYDHSKFDKSFSIVKVWEEKEWTEEILSLLQSIFGQVILKKGNHDIRREQRFQRMAMTMPELEGLANYDDFVMFDNSRVKIVEDYNIIQYGKLNTIHGHEFQGGGGIHVAYNRLQKAMTSLLSAHSHIAQSRIHRNIRGEVFGSWTLGCLCDLHPRYNPINNWSQGFARIEKDSTGEFEVDNRVIHGTKTFGA